MDLSAVGSGAVGADETLSSIINGATLARVGVSTPRQPTCIGDAAAKETAVVVVELRRRGAAPNFIGGAEAAAIGGGAVGARKARATVGKSATLARGCVSTRWDVGCIWSRLALQLSLDVVDVQLRRVARSEDKL